MLVGLWMPMGSKREHPSRFLARRRFGNANMGLRAEEIAVNVKQIKKSPANL